MTYIPATCLKTFFVVITEDLCLTKDLKNNPIGINKVNDNFKGKKTSEINAESCGIQKFSRNSASLTFSITFSKNLDIQL